jgi:hypothetical protein
MTGNILMLLICAFKMFNIIMLFWDTIDSIITCRENKRKKKMIRAEAKAGSLKPGVKLSVQKGVRRVTGESPIASKIRDLAIKNVYQIRPRIIIPEDSEEEKKEERLQIQDVEESANYSNTALNHSIM